MISIRRGLDLPIAGAPEQQVHDGPRVRTVAVLGPEQGQRAAPPRPARPARPLLKEEPARFSLSREIDLKSSHLIRLFGQISTLFIIKREFFTPSGIRGVNQKKMGGL